MFRKFSKVGLAIATAAVLWLAPTHAIHAAPLEDDQIVRQIVNKTFSMRGPSGFRAEFRLTGEGQAFLSKANQGPREDQGIWWVKLDTLCTKWNTLRDNAVECMPIERIKAGNYKMGDGFTLIRK